MSKLFSEEWEHDQKVDAALEKASKLPAEPEEFDLGHVEDIELDGINHDDYPDFCDAYIVSATYKGRPMTEDELEHLNDDASFVYEQVIKQLY